MSAGPSAVRIRKYAPADHAACRQVTIDAFAALCFDRRIEERHGPINGTRWPERKASQIDREAAGHPDGVFVADIEGRVVGVVTSEANTETGIGHIPNLAVAPDCQGKGIAKLLMDACLKHLRAEGMTHARIETMVGNEVADAYYRRMGFQEIGRAVHFFGELDSLAADRAAQNA